MKCLKSSAFSVWAWKSAYLTTWPGDSLAHKFEKWCLKCIVRINKEQWFLKTTEKQKHFGIEKAKGLLASVMELFFP